MHQWFSFPLIALKWVQQNIANHFAFTDPCFGSTHGAEIPFQFPSMLLTRPGTGNYKFTPQEQELSKDLIMYWSNFVVSGSPNRNAFFQMNLKRMNSSSGGGDWQTATEWPRYSICNDSQLYLQMGGHVVDQGGMYGKVCPFWNPFEQLPVFQCNASEPIPPNPPIPKPQPPPPVASPSPVKPKVSSSDVVAKKSTTGGGGGGSSGPKRSDRASEGVSEVDMMKTVMS